MPNNPRLSTASSGAGESDGELQLNQLVVAQVHHDPILEIPSVEDKETGEITIKESGTLLGWVNGCNYTHKCHRDTSCFWHSYLNFGKGLIAQIE